MRGPITLLLPSSLIKDGTRVRKPTGDVVYTLTRKLEIFYSKGAREVVETPAAPVQHAGLVFLIGGHNEGQVSACPDTKVFAVDFPDLIALSRFLQPYVDAEEEKGMQ